MTDYNNPTILTGSGNSTFTNSSFEQAVPGTKPSALADGDLLIAFLVSQQSTNDDTTKITCDEPDWIQIGPPFALTKRPTSAYGMPVPVASEIDDSHWIWHLATNARCIVSIHRVINADLTAWLDHNPSVFAVTATPWRETAFEAMVTDRDNELAVYISHAVNTNVQSNGIWTPPAGTTLFVRRDSVVSGTASNDSLNVAVKNAGVAGTIAAVSSFMNTDMSASAGLSFTLRGSVVGSLPTTAGLSIFDGTDEIPTHVSVWDGTSERPVSYPRAYAGPQNIVDFMAGDLPFSAHRGGSNNFPEETLYGYKQSHNRGLRALEISVWKTSDGSFAACHDRSTLRTTGIDLDITTQTRATLAAMSVLPVGTSDQTQPSRPFAFLDEILSLYGNGGPIIFIDDKGGTNTTALMDYLDTFENSKERFILKIYGTGNDAQKTAWRARGYKIWAYYFVGSDMSNIIVGGVVGGNIELCDYVGLDYNLSDADFGLVVAYGKPVFAHIISNPTQRDRVLGLGAIGAMVSNIETTVPGAGVL